MKNFRFNLPFAILLAMSIITFVESRDLSILRITNVQDSLTLDIKTLERAPVFARDNLNNKNQRWIVDFEAATGLTNCSIFEPLDQNDDKQVKVLTEDSIANIIVGSGGSELNQRWCLERVNNYWQIKNINSQRCLASQGKDIQVRTEICNSTNSRILWNIHNYDASTFLWSEHWFDHRQNVTNVFQDQDVTIYYDNDMSRSIIWPMYFVRDVWRYTKQVYGSFGPSQRLFSIFHKGKYGGGHPGYFSSSMHDNRNVIDCGNQADNAWEDKEGWSIDIIIHEIGHVVESTFHRYEGSPAFPVWGDSKWAEIYIYDVYKGLGMDTEANDRYEQFMRASDNFPSPNTFWFRDWFYPIYANYGGSLVLKRFFELLTGHFPKEGFAYSRNLNLGEFVHFYSGAANQSLKAQATIAFGWNSDLENQFNNAQIEFPNIIY